MATAKCFSLVRGRVMRVTRLDGCGAPTDVGGECSSVTSEGFISVAFTANTDEGEEISVTNAAGKVCVRDTPCPSFLGYTAEIQFCEVDPTLFSLITGQKSVFDDDSNEAVGFRVNSDISGCDSGFALEIWSNVPGVACGEGGGEGAYGYLLLPFLQGGIFGDFTIENAAVTFTISGAATKTGSGWGVGPYDVVPQPGGGSGPLTEPIGNADHLHIQLTNVGPPAPGCGCDALAAAQSLGATSGTPGTWTPPLSTPPPSVSALKSASPAITASPTSAWTTGQYMQTGTAGASGEAYWDGNSWEAGRAV